MSAPRPRRSCLLRRALVLVAALGLLTLAAEVALRVAKPFALDFPLYPDDDLPLAELRGSTVVDPTLGWRFVADAVIDDPSPDFHVTYRCNAEGFRASPERPASGDEVRVVFVGDSFTFGTGVEAGELFVDRIAAAHEGVHVFNYGMAGYGVDQMWRAAVELGLKHEPRIVVATFVVEDLSRSLTSWRFRQGWCAKPSYTLDDGELVVRSAANSPGAFWRWCERTPHLAEVWRRAENKLGLHYGFGRRFVLNRELFRALRDACAAAGAELVVMHVPQRGAWKPARAFAGAFATLEIPFLDLGTTQPADPRSLYFAHDPHIDAEGHAYVAEQLSRFLVARSLIAEPGR